MNAAVLAAGAAGRLQLVGRAGVGVDNVDGAAAAAAGVVVMSTPLGNSRSAAELAMAMMLALARRTAEASAAVRAGQWGRSGKGMELRDKTLGIVGLGSIGQEVATLAQALEMRVAAFDPTLTDERAAALGVHRATTLPRLLAASDVVTLHAKSGEAGPLLGAAELACLRPGALLVNTARGSLLDHAALFAALQDGRVGGAALDVYPSEPPADELRPLLEHPNVLCSPHLGASTAEAQTKVAVDIARQLCDVWDGKGYSGVTNAPHLALASTKRGRPLAALAQAVGSLVGQTAPQGVDTVHVELHGAPWAPAGKDVDPAYGELAVCASLTGLLAGGTSLVSAPAAAEAAGVRAGAAPLAGDPEADLLAAAHGVVVRVTAKAPSGAQRSAAGALARGGEARIVSLDGSGAAFPAFAPRHHVLVYANEDRPGVVSGVTAALGDAGLNIAQLNVVRQADGDALSCVVVDEPLDEAVADAVRGLAGVRAGSVLKASFE